MGIQSTEMTRRIKLFFRDLCNVQAFVETGTYRADTALWASSNFDQVYTIELSPHLHKQVSSKYQSYTNIIFLNGNSAEILSKIIAEISQPSIFWLDGHWSGGDTVGEENECPLLQEIEAINHFGYEKFIFIDDARLFLSPPPPPHNTNYWPTIAEIIKKIEQDVPDSYTVVYNDVIISVPSKYKNAFVRFLQNLNELKAVPDKTKESKIYKQDTTDIRSGTIKWLIHDENVLGCLKNEGLWDGHSPLRLHLGCGESRLEGYVNVDFPPTEHTIQKKSAADIYADITKLLLPDQCVDEIRLHHVFEHFERTQAFALLVQWHQWLKIGAKLYIETPDIVGCAEALVSNRPYADKQAILRHAFGSQEAQWASHLDGWFAEKFQHILSRFGFKTQCQRKRRPAWPYLTDVEAIAVKENHRNASELLNDAAEILKDSLVSDAPSELRMHQVWCDQLKYRLNKFDLQPKPAGSKHQAKTQVCESSEMLRHDISNLIVVDDCPAADHLGYDDDRITENGELDFVSQIIKPADVVFDVGANKGAWCEMVLEINSAVTIFAFEPVPRAFKSLKAGLNYANIELHNLAVSEADKEQIFYHYSRDQQVEEMSSFYRRSKIEKKLNISPSPVSVRCVSLDSFCSKRGIPKINFLKIDTEGSELDALQGAKSMLRSRKIDVVQFEYGGTFLDAGISLKQIFEFLTGFGYRVFRIVHKGLIYISKWRDALETYRYANYVAFAAGEDPKRVHECLNGSRVHEAVYVVFSKDRALQLDAAISSLRLHCADLQGFPVKVIFKASNPTHRKQYTELQRIYPEVEFIAENNFKQDLISAIRKCAFVVFLVDDNLFVRKFHLSNFIDTLKKQTDAIGFSLRLGKNTQYCYMLDRRQQLPEFKSISDDIIVFNWVHAECDFAYPLELSSSIYRVEELKSLLKALNYENPNNLESLLHENRFQFSEKSGRLLCSSTSIAFCNPINKVQNVCASNRAGENPLNTTEKLSELFEKGYRIDVAELTGFAPNSCHQEVALKMKKPEGSPPKVSVVTPCFNYGKYLRAAVESVIGQTYQNFEMIIINDGSTDNTKEVAESIIAKYPNYSIRLINQKNSGQPAISRNRGILEANGEYILCLDADDMLLPTMLEKCMNILEQDRSIAIAYTDRQDFDGVNQIVRAKNYDFSQLKYANHISYCALFRREVWDKIGGYRTNIKGCEDWDFWVAAGARGYFGRRIPEPLFKYRRHDTGVYQEVLENYNTKFAQIILNNQEIYNESDLNCAVIRLGKKAKIQSDAFPLVSVIVPTLNRPEMLKETLKSILNQTYPNFEIVVVNDGGEDVSEILNQINDKRINYIAHTENKGAAASRNTGIKNASGEFIALLDDDDIFYPEHLEIAAKNLSEEHPVIYTDAIRASYERCGSTYKLIKKNVPYSIDFDRNKLLVGNISPVNCFVFNKNLAFKVGLFDETLRTLEDWDFWIRLSALTPFKHVVQTTVQVNWRNDGTTMTSLLGSEFRKNREIIYSKYQDEINQIPNKSKIIEEFHQIWTKDWQTQSQLTSIIILTCNQLEYSKKCIDSIFKHTQEPFELILVDNGSTDGTVEYLESEIAVRKRAVRVKIIKNKKNKGFAAGNNQGIATAKGDYILLMNNDVVVTPGWLGRMIACAEKNLKIGIVGPRSNYVSGPQLVEKVNYDINTQKGLTEFSKQFAEQHAQQDQQILRVVGFCMLIKKAVIEAIGGMDDRYGLGNFEDDDFSLRASIAGFQSWIALGSFIHHFGNRTFVGEKIDYRSSLSKNWKIFKEKWGLPIELPYGSPYNLSQMKHTTFDHSVHYYPLEEEGNSGAKTPQDLYHEVQPLLNNGDPHRAIGALARLLEQFPDFALAHNDLGVLYYQTGDKEKAQHHYERAVEMMPENINFQKNLADFYCLELGRIEEALKIYVDILTTHPKDIETLLATGQICVALEKPGDARDFFNQVLEIEPWNEAARQHLEALERPSSPAVLVNAESPDEIYQRLKQNLSSLSKAEAIDELEKLLGSYPDLAMGHNDLGVLYYHTGEKEKALRHYQQAAHLQPENITLQKNLADFLFVELEKVEEALQIYVDILATHPDDVETLLIAGHICVALKKFDDAKDFYEQVLALEPDNEDANKNFQVLLGRQSKRPSGRPDSLNDMTVSNAKVELSDLNAKESENQDAEPKTAVSIVLSLNGIQNRVKQCIESIAAHTEESHEIILINNGATKGILKWAQNLVKDNAHYQLVKYAKTHSWAQCLSQAVKAAAGEYNVLMHNDVMVADRWLSGMHQCFRAGSEIGVVGPMTNETSGIQKVYFPDDWDPSRLESDAKAFYEQNQFRRVSTTQLASFCLMFRRELIDKIGDFDAQLVSEQAVVVDFCKRSAAWGFQNLVAGDVIVYHADRHKGNRKTSGTAQIPTEDKKRLKENWNKPARDQSLSKGIQMMSMLETVNELHQKGYIDQAVETLLHAIGAVPEEKRLYLALAEISISLRRYQDAIDTLNELPADAKTEMDSEETGKSNESGFEPPSLVVSDNYEMKTLEILGYAEEGLDNFAAAEEYADRMLSIDPKSARALNLKGILAYRKKDLNSAEKFFEKSIASDPGAGEPYSNLATLKLAAGKEKEALKQFEKSFILSPTDLDIATNYHVFVSESGDYERAEKVANQAAALYPNNRKIEYMLIDFLVQQGKYDKTMGKIEAAIVKFGIEDGILAAALQVREKLGPLTIKPSKKKTTVSCCMIIKDEEKYLARCLASVKPIVDEMIVVDTGSADRSKDIATAFGAQVYDIEWQKDFAKARNFSLEKASGDWILIMDGDEVISSLDYKHFNQIVKNRPKAPVAYTIVTRNYSALANIVGWVSNDGKYVNEEAVAGWIPSVKTRLFYGRDQIWFEGAVHELVDPVVKKKGFETKNCSIPIHHYGRLDKERLERKGELYFEIGKKKMEEMGDDIFAVREMAIQATTLEKNEMAVKLWQRLISLDPSEIMVADAYINMATLYNRLSNFEQALLVAKKAVAIAPHIKESHYNYALAELHLGNAQATLKVLEELVHRIPDYPPAQFILSAAYFCLGEKEEGFKIIRKLQATALGPNLAYPIFELAETLIKAQQNEYALLSLGAAIECDIVNKQILGLFNNCIQMIETAKNSPERPRPLPLDRQPINFENLPQIDSYC